VQSGTMADWNLCRCDYLDLAFTWTGVKNSGRIVSRDHLENARSVFHNTTLTGRADD
jgi:hypothetical protein